MPTGYNPGGMAIGTPSVTLTGTPSAGQVPTATGANAATWQAGIGGATIPNTTNLIKGDNAGNGADSGIDPNDVVLDSTVQALPDGSTATTQIFSDDSTKVATTAFARGVAGTSQSTGIQKGNGTGGFQDAVPGTDYLAPGALPDGTTATTQAAADSSTKVATMEALNNLLSSSGFIDAVNALILAQLQDSGALGTILDAASVFPVANGTQTPVTSITTVSGIVTATA